MPHCSTRFLIRFSCFPTVRSFTLNLATCWSRHFYFEPLFRTEGANWSSPLTYHYSTLDGLLFCIILKFIGQYPNSKNTTSLKMRAFPGNCCRVSLEPGCNECWLGWGHFLHEISFQSVFPNWVRNMWGKGLVTSRRPAFLFQLTAFWWCCQNDRTLFAGVSKRQ